MAAPIHPLDLPHDPIYDDPDYSDTPLTTIVMRAPQRDLVRAEEQFGRSVVFCPRVTDTARVHSRSRRVARMTSPQWPGYAFVHTLHATESLLYELVSRYFFHHLLDDRTTIIPVSQLQPSRHLERTSQLRTVAPSIPAPPEVGDLVSVQAGRWSAFQGVVTEVRHSMVVIAVPHSILTVRADLSAVTIVDRKKVLAE